MGTETPEHRRRGVGHGGCSDDGASSHTPVIYIEGDPTDIAYETGWTTSSASHMCRPRSPICPSDTAARSTNPMAARPHRWQWAGSIGSFRGDTQSAKRFVGEDCGLCKDAQWSLQRKQFPETRGSR
jgi:hypothetical protein